MRKFWIISGIITLAACKPEVYLGPLDSPLGNWKAEMSEYYFDGENVYEAPGCTYSAISFYKDSLCCIEGVKGTFIWTYDADSLVIDSTAWRVITLTGQRMELDYIGEIDAIEASQAKSGAEEENSSADGNETSTIEYKGRIIRAEKDTYWYTDSEEKTVQCFPMKGTAVDGSDSTLCWWDTRTDFYLPF